MPLTKESLATRIVTEMMGSKGAPADASKLQEFADAVAAAVVDEIKQNGIVTTTVTGSSVSGGAVTGAGTGTIT